MALVRIPLGEDGSPMGQYHVRAQYPDALVDDLRTLHEERGLGWRRLSAMFPLLPPDWIKRVVSFRRRNAIAKRWRVTVETTVTTHA